MLQATRSDLLANPKMSRRLDRQPDRLRSIPVTSGLFRELLASQAGASTANRRHPAERLSDLAAFLVARPMLACRDLDDPAELDRLERARLASILESAFESPPVRPGGRLAAGFTAPTTSSSIFPWVAGGSILVSPGGWAVGFESRPIRRNARVIEEVSWVADTCGLRCLWERCPSKSGWKVILALPDAGVPDLDNFDSIVRDAGVSLAAFGGV
jgi:hypothetical protein